ncbi:hypothetical protein AB1E19_015546 [Capra hircus]
MRSGGRQGAAWRPGQVRAQGHLAVTCSTRRRTRPRRLLILQVPGAPGNLCSPGTRGQPRRTWAPGAPAASPPRVGARAPGGGWARTHLCPPGLPAARSRPARGAGEARAGRGAGVQPQAGAGCARGPRCVGRAGAALRAVRRVRGAPAAIQLPGLGSISVRGSQRAAAAAPRSALGTQRRRPCTRTTLSSGQVNRGPGYPTLPQSGRSLGAPGRARGARSGGAADGGRRGDQGYGRAGAAGPSWWLAHPGRGRGSEGRLGADQGRRPAAAARSGPAGLAGPLECSAAPLGTGSPPLSQSSRMHKGAREDSDLVMQPGCLDGAEIRESSWEPPDPISAGSGGACSFSKDCITRRVFRTLPNRLFLWLPPGDDGHMSPTMAHRKRQSVASSLLDHRARPGPEPESEDAELALEEYVPTDLELAALRPESPAPAEQGGPDQSPDGDSSSDYVNNTSEEEDYDEGLPEEEEGITYYIRYCPEDDSYLQGTDCDGQGYLAHDTRHLETDECQEAVEEWTEPTGPHAHGHSNPGSPGYRDSHLSVPEDEASVLDSGDQEEDVHYCPGEEAYQDYYPAEANGNAGSKSPYRPRRRDGDPEDQEEDIDQIVAEIKMSLSMSSITSGGEASPEREPRGPEPGPGDSPEACPPAEASRGPSRHEGRPKSLNLPPEAKHPADPQRSFKTKTRTPEERPKWPQEEVCNGLEQPRKQQRSDLNGPVDNNNIPETKKVASFPSFVAVPGPCEPEDLIDGIIFAANYLGSTQLLSERNPSKNIRMMQAQEAVSRVKRMQKAAKIKKKANSEGDAQTLTEVDLFISTQRIKVLNADTQETMMDHALRTISYIADIGNIVVLMARRRMPRSASQDCIETTPGAQEGKKQYKMICHVFESEDAQLIAQSIGQAFSVAYQEFLRANGINPEDLSQKEYSDIINTQEMYNDDLIHFSNSENCKELQLEKHKGEILGVVVVESGWGSILPTVILANMMNGGPAARSGKLSIGDQIMSINGTSLVGLPLATCQGIIKGLKNQTQVKLNIVSCPPVTTVLIKRPDLKYQLGFSVQNGIICSLMRGGIAERGGVRVGHRIIEINGQSVVATAHEKIVQALSNSVGEIHMKTMPAAMFRLLTGQETPLYI